MNIKNAIEIAIKAHEGQTRWDKKIPYVQHLINVCALATNEVDFIENSLGEKYKDLRENVQMVSWLHDVVEDTKITLEDLKKAGFNKTVLDAVKAITKTGEVSYVDYIKNLSKNEVASIVKMADIEHNLKGLNKGSMKDKYEFAYAFLAGDLW